MIPFRSSVPSPVIVINFLQRFIIRGLIVEWEVQTVYSRIFYSNLKKKKIKTSLKYTFYNYQNFGLELTTIKL